MSKLNTSCAFARRYKWILRGLFFRQANSAFFWLSFLCSWNCRNSSHWYSFINVILLNKFAEPIFSFTHPYDILLIKISPSPNKPPKIITLLYYGKMNCHILAFILNLTVKSKIEIPVLNGRYLTWLLRVGF